MAIGSRVNINFPIPGLDQSSKGFRDNFATIKRELEQIQGTTIQLVGAINSAPYAIGGSGNDAIELSTTIYGGAITLDPPDMALQFNRAGRLVGDENLFYDQANGVVGIGTNAANPNFSLDVRGGILTDGAFYNVKFEGSQVADNYMMTTTSIGSLSLTQVNMVVGAYTATPLVLFTDSIARLNITEYGWLGIGTATPQSVMHVEATSQDMGYWHVGTPNTDNMVRATTDTINTTVAWGLEQKHGNWLGGIRIDEAGTVSIHSGEDAGSQLSTTTARISINNAGLVGIGNHSPAHNLDVNGSIHAMELHLDADSSVGGAVIAAGPYVGVDMTVTSIDQVPMGSFRTARYTVQVTKGPPGSEVVEVTECMVTNANGTPHLRVIDTYSTGSSLGTLSVSVDIVDPTWMLLNYQGNADGNVVRLSKTYIPS